MIDFKIENNATIRCERNCFYLLFLTAVDKSKITSKM